MATKRLSYYAGPDIIFFLMGQVYPDFQFYYGGVSEWLKELAWKACVRESVPWVRIPPPPNKKEAKRLPFFCSEEVGWLPFWKPSCVSSFRTRVRLERSERDNLCGA